MRYQKMWPNPFLKGFKVTSQVILGLDPGLRHTGWGVMATDGQNFSYIAHGVISPREKDLSVRLRVLFENLCEVIDAYQPTMAAVEETFVNVNPRSTLKLGMARGAVMLAPAIKGLDVGEYSPNKVKQTVVGVGHAGKEQVMTMVRYLLPHVNRETLTADAADALAVALCHAQHIWAEKRFGAQRIEQ